MKDASSTRNLLRHAKLCWGKEALAAAKEARDLDEIRDKIIGSIKKNGSITAAIKHKGKGETYSHRLFTKIEMRTECMKWVMESLWPFQIVRDPGFLRLVKMGRPGYYVPSPSTVSRNARVIFVHTRVRLAHFLRRYAGRLNFATDTWTAENHCAFVVILVFLEQRGKVLVIVLDLVEVPEAHTGMMLVCVFVDVLKAFGIADKLLGVTCDNMSNNNAMIVQMGELIETFNGQGSRVHCFAHVLNLVAKSLIVQFNARVEKEARDAEVDEAKLHEPAAGLDLEELTMHTEAASQAKAEEGDGENADDPVDEVDPMDELSGPAHAKFQCDVLPVKLLLAKVFKDATTFFSRTEVPNLVTVIPAIDHIDAHLTDISRDTASYEEPIRITCELAKQTLNKYYSLTDTSKAYRIAMVLHLRHKLTYFKSINWSEEWITTAHDIVKAEYKKHYEGRFQKKDLQEGHDNGHAHEDGVDNEDDGRKSSENTPNVHNDVMDDEANIFDSLASFKPPTKAQLSDKLVQYLNTDPEHTEDVLQWWINHQVSYPNLSRMAIDYLTMPATSVPVEHTFSIGQLLLPYMRNCLQGQT
ncbi:Zinc finger BED domain-containing protein RICESLEEPER 2, partial [Trametes pubescens]